MTEEYTVFLVDGYFLDAFDLETDTLRIQHVSRKRLFALFDLAAKNNFDMVIRKCEEVSDDGMDSEM